MYFIIMCLHECVLDSLKYSGIISIFISIFFVILEVAILSETPIMLLKLLTYWLFSALFSNMIFYSIKFIFLYFSVGLNIVHVDWGLKYNINKLFAYLKYLFYCFRFVTTSKVNQSLPIFTGFTLFWKAFSSIVVVFLCILETVPLKSRYRTIRIGIQNLCR